MPRTRTAALALAAALAACGGGKVEELAASGTRSCLRVDRNVECWGGTRGTTPGAPLEGSTQPERLKVEYVTEICTGDRFACGRREDGRILCGPTTPGTELVGVPGILRAHTMACGPAGGCILDFESVRCWTWGAEGPDGVAPVEGLGGGGVSVSVGGAHTCAAFEGGALFCWGDNSKGQLGLDPNQVRSAPAPVRVTGVGGVTGVAAGGEHTCVIASGQVQCFGANEFGQLGRGGTTSHLPLPVFSLGEATDLAAGLDHACAIDADGALHCWGRNDSGQLGDGTDQHRFTAAPVPGLEGVIDVALGDAHSCALPSDGTPRCWGQNLAGQLGDGTFDSRATPAPVNRPE